MTTGNHEGLKRHMALREAIEAVPGDMRDDVRHHLLVLADKLHAVDTKWGELGTEARLIWLDAQNGDLHSPMGLRRLLGSVSSAVSFVDNWSDCARSGTPREDDDWTEIEAARVAGAEALGKLHVLVDEVRDNMQPNWRPDAAPELSPIAADQ